MRRKWFILLSVILILTSSGCFFHRISQNEVIKLPPVVVKAENKKPAPTPATYSTENTGPSLLTDRIFVYNYLLYDYYLTRGDIPHAYDALETVYYYHPSSDFARKLCLIAYFLKKYDNAILYGKAYLEKYPDTPKIMKIVADSYYREGNFDEAEKYFKEIYSYSKKNPFVILRLVQINVAQKNFVKARKLLEEIKLQRPDLYDYVNAKISILQGKPSDAENYLLSLRKISPDFLPGIRDLALLYISTGRVQDAIKLLNQVLKDHPEWVELRLILAKAYDIGKEGEKARNELKKLKNELKKGADWTLDFAIAFSYLNEGKISDAIEILQSLSKRYPDNNIVKLYLSLSYAMFQEYDKAIDTLDSIRSSNQKIKGVVQYFKASIYYQMGEEDKSVNILKSLIISKPFPGVFLLLADIYQKQKKYEQEIEVVKRGLDVFPENTALLYKLGISYDFLKRYDEALATMEKILQITPNNPDALNYIGYYYADHGIKLDEAEDLVKKALNFKPDDPYIIDSLGWVYFKKGEYKKARFYLEKAIKNLNYPEPEIFEHMGDIYFRLKNYNGALEYYERSYQNYEDLKAKKRILKKIDKVKKIFQESP